MRTHLYFIFFWLFLIGLISFQTTGLAQSPVNPNATPEAKALLQYLYDIRGKHLISGMHNEQTDPDSWDQTLMARNGKVEPGLWGNDFRYGDHATPDRRQAVAEEAMRQWREKGKIITFMYHQVQPQHEEIDCCGGNPWENSVHVNNLTDAQFEALLTPGTEMYDGWQIKMDTVARYLQQLEDRHIPVLFRPYHEMNGGWFWWGQKSDGEQFKRLYRQTYEYLTHTKGLNNILWVLNYDDTNNELAVYYPGDAYVDVIATDIYGGDFSAAHYRALKEVAGGKPIAIGEVGRMTSVSEIRRSYPDFVWFMGWRKLFFRDTAGKNEGNTDDEIRKFFASPYILNAEDLPDFTNESE